MKKRFATHELVRRVRLGCGRHELDVDLDRAALGRDRRDGGRGLADARGSVDDDRPRRAEHVREHADGVGRDHDRRGAMQRRDPAQPAVDRIVATQKRDHPRIDVERAGARDFDQPMRDERIGRAANHGFVGLRECEQRHQLVDGRRAAANALEHSRPQCGVDEWSRGGHQHVDRGDVESRMLAQPGQR